MIRRKRRCERKRGWEEEEMRIGREERKGREGDRWKGEDGREQKRRREREEEEIDLEGRKRRVGRNRTEDRSEGKRKKGR